MKLTSLAAATALCVVSLSAHAGSGFRSWNGGLATATTNDGSAATPYDLGTLGSAFSVLFVTVPDAGSFTEYAQFVVPPNYGATNGAANTYALTMFDLLLGPVTVGSITGFQMSVVPGTPTLPGATIGGPFAAGASFAGLPMSPGTYHFVFAGTVNGLGGQYAAAIQAVPEPETYAMMLAGIGAISFVAWRRRYQG